MPSNPEDVAAIAERNRLRREALLPLLDVEPELQRLKAVRDRAEFERYFEEERHRFSYMMAGREGWAARMGAWTQMRQRLRREWVRSRSRNP